MKPTELIQHINALHQTTFVLLEKYPDGEQGAFVITDHLGRQQVLKWTPDALDLQWMQGAKIVTELLRGLGYPAPHYLLIGTIPEGTYSVQDILLGSPMRQLSSALLPRLFALNQLQVGRAIPTWKDWHQEVIDTLLWGGERYCLHTSLQEHSRETADLLQALRALTMAYQAEPHRTDDIVHGDFQHANILIYDEQISGVVDWDGFGRGDCIFDIVTLLFYAYETVEVRQQLWDYVLSQASLRLVSIYIAHLILRQVDWSLRYHDQATSECYIHRGKALLQEIADRTRLNR
jgi:hypothetical protein